MLGDGLGGTERALKSLHDDAAVLQVNIIQSKVTYLGSPHTVLVSHNNHRPLPSALGLCRFEHRKDFCRFKMGHRGSGLLTGIWGCWHMVSPKMQQYVQTLSSKWVAKSFICDTANSKNATQWLVCCIISLYALPISPAQRSSVLPEHLGNGGRSADLRWRGCTRRTRDCTRDTIRQRCSGRRRRIRTGNQASSAGALWTGH